MLRQAKSMPGWQTSSLETNRFPAETEFDLRTSNHGRALTSSQFGQGLLTIGDSPTHSAIGGYCIGGFRLVQSGNLRLKATRLARLDTIQRMTIGYSTTVRGIPRAAPRSKEKSLRVQ
jgi:hypothetical protein